MIFHVKMEGVSAPELQFSVLFWPRTGGVLLHTFTPSLEGLVSLV